MKNKKFALLGVAAVAALGLASCGGEQGGSATSSTVKNNPLDIAVNYSAKQGITMRQDSYVNKADGKTYSKGDLLPTWNAYQSAVKASIREASAYSASTDNDYYTKIDTAGYKSETDTNQYIDLFYNTTANINKMGAAGKAVDLKTMIDAGYMPNFKKFLENNPTIARQLTQSGKIYYTPYFDGYNAVERMQIMDVNMAKAILDDANAGDTTKTNGTGASANVLQAAKLTPFIDANKNYPTDNFQVKVSVNGEVKTIQVKQTNNIIKQQNELLAAGATGKALADQFRAYLTAAYGHEVGSGKTFAKLSDIFVSEQAAYNTDELLALMRVVKANPGVVAGDENQEVEVFCIRGVASNRVQNVYHLLSLFGIQGMDSEKEGLFFDANGKLNDAYALESTYEALEFVSAMYDEGLILNDFFNSASTLGSTGYLNKYFGKMTDDGGYGFMLYDYSASTGAVNTIDSVGIGTKDEKRVGSFKNTSVTGVMPVLPPVTWWATEKTWDHAQSLSDHTGMTLIRRSTSNRTLKGNSWCIPTSSDNKEIAAKLMDYMFSAEGQIVNDFGPKSTAYWKSINEADFISYGGDKTPVFSDNLKTMISESGTDFWSFMRGYVGSTHGIGYIRTASINYQATNANAQIGTKNIETAIANGVVCLDKVDKNGDTISFDNSVPTAGYGSESDKTKYQAITAFWAADKCAATATGWVKVVVDPAGTYTKASTGTIGIDGSSNNYSYKDVFDQIPERISAYLYDIVSGYDSKLLPDYAKAN